MKSSSLSEKRVQRLRLQGFISQSPQELSQLAFGIRFAYRVCTSLLIVGVLTKSIWVFTGMLIVAFFGATLPNHPFDYVYNHLLSSKMDKPQLPPRSPQLKFACTIATFWLGTIVYLMSAGSISAALILAMLFITVAGLLSITDICIPSIIYDALFRKNSVGQKA